MISKYSIQQPCCPTYLFVYGTFRMNMTKFGNCLSSWQLRRSDLQCIKDILNWYLSTLKSITRVCQRKYST